jgi:hypothetical protein
MAIEEQDLVAVESSQPSASPPKWRVLTKIAFRFCVAYFGLYIVLTQMLTSLLFATTNDSGAFELDTTPPAKAAIVWIAGHVFRIAHPIVTVETGSGDRVYDWVEVATILAIAIIVTIAWSWLDRKRQSYAKLHSCFRVFARFSLAATMFTYGAAKAIPLQMPFPYLHRLLERYGDFSPMGVLWASIGASPAYEIFAGCAEIFGGILLVLPRTTTLGALVCLADATQIFTLNMTYDVPVKLLSFHLILLSLFLLAPDVKRLADFFVLDRPAPRSSDRPLFRTARSNRIALVVQICVGIFLLGANLYGSISAYNVYGPGRPKSALYGIWNVETLTVDGQDRPPLLTDSTRWRRVVFDSPQSMSIQDVNDKTQSYGAKIDMKQDSLTLTKRDDSNWKASFSFSRPAVDQLTFDGTMDDHTIQAQLKLLDLSKFLLVTRGFHWVQDHPFNR